MLIPAVVVVVVIFAILLIVGREKKRNEQKEVHYNSLAERYGLARYITKKSVLSGKLFSLKGNYQNIDIHIFEDIRKSGKSSRYYTLIEIPFPHSFQFRIGKENFFTRMGKLIGFNDIEFNEDEVDREYLFKADDETAFRNFMNYELIAVLNNNKQYFKGVLSAENERLTYTVQDEIRDGNRQATIESMLELMLKFAKS